MCCGVRQRVGVRIPVAVGPWKKRNRRISVRASQVEHQVLVQWWYWLMPYASWRLKRLLQLVREAHEL